ncbi:MAG: Holliday junction resolvase RuvX [Bacillota bacterium]
MRIMGLDVGSKTIGIALSDPDRIVSQPFSVIKRTEEDEDIKELCRIIGDKEVSLIVVGLPKRTDGSLGKSAMQVMEFAEALKEAVSVPVVTWDERFSTTAAERSLIFYNVYRQKRKGVIDSVAASIILDNYMDFLRKRSRDSQGTESKNLSLENIASNRIAGKGGVSEMPELNEIVTLIYDDGEQETFTVEEILEVEGKTYVVLVPEEMDFEDDEDVEIDAFIFKVEEKEDGEEILVELDDDEYEKITEILCAEDEDDEFDDDFEDFFDDEEFDVDEDFDEDLD